MRKRGENDEPVKQIPLRLPVSLIVRVEEHLGRMRRGAPGVAMCRADALRSLLVSALDAAEASVTKTNSP